MISNSIIKRILRESLLEYESSFPYNDNTLIVYGEKIIKHEGVPDTEGYLHYHVTIPRDRSEIDWEYNGMSKDGYEEFFNQQHKISRADKSLTKEDWIWSHIDLKIKPQKGNKSITLSTLMKIIKMPSSKLCVTINENFDWIDFAASTPINNQIQVLSINQENATFEDENGNDLLEGYDYILEGDVRTYRVFKLIGRVEELKQNNPLGFEDADSDEFDDKD